MTEVLVEIQNLTKTFGKGEAPACKEISGTITQGQIVGLVGPDGAGKTTLIRLLASLLTPTEGHIRLSGYDTMKDSEAIHALTGYMPQRFGLYEDLTVLQNLDLYAALQGVHGEEKEAAFEKLLHFTGLKPFGDRFAKNLSGGMKQKLGLACALIKKPTLLLLDEPSVGVDPISRRELWKMVTELLKEGVTVVWSTSYLDEAEKCDSVLLLSGGKLLYHGTPQEFTKRALGRVYKITEIDGDRRALLYKVLQEKDVMDGIIQGRDLRIMVKDGAPPPPLPNNVVVRPDPPRFEDAFIDLLGGGPGGKSELAEKAPQVSDGHKAVVAADHLTKKFGKFIAVNNISFEVKKGEIFGLLGPNGAGKSTTFKMLCGLLRPTEGKAVVSDLDLQVAPGPARARIGYMAQKFSLYGNLSVKQNLTFFSGIYNLAGEAQEKAIEEMTKIFDLHPYLDAAAQTLPLGFKQRLALACATMHHPDVLFLDEPTSGVDPITRREFWSHINGLVGKGVTVTVTTHFMDEAEYCDRIALIYRGKIIAMETPNTLKDLGKTEKNPSPTLEDAFIQLIEKYDAENPL